MKVGTVDRTSASTRQTFLADADAARRPRLRLPADTSAEIASEGLLGGSIVSLVPGGATASWPMAGGSRSTQGSVSLEALLGRFIFSVTQMNTQQQPAAARGRHARRRPR